MLLACLLFVFGVKCGMVVLLCFVILCVVLVLGIWFSTWHVLVDGCIYGLYGPDYLCAYWGPTNRGRGWVFLMSDFDQVFVGKRSEAVHMFIFY